MESIILNSIPAKSVLLKGTVNLKQRLDVFRETIAQLLSGKSQEAESSTSPLQICQPWYEIAFT